VRDVDGQSATWLIVVALVMTTTHPRCGVAADEPREAVPEFGTPPVEQVKPRSFRGARMAAPSGSSPPTYRKTVIGARRENVAWSSNSEKE